MDTRDTPEQAELRRSARQLARELGPATVGDLDDVDRAKRLHAAVRDAGWLELRDDDGRGAPLASGVEAAILAEALASCVADAPFAGVVLAHDLARRAGATAPMETVACSVDLLDVLILDPGTPAPSACAVDTPTDSSSALVLVHEDDGHRLVQVATDAPIEGGTDLTRTVATIAEGMAVAPVPGADRLLTADDLDAWRALGLALTSADLVGVMRGVLDVTVTYAADRRQFGVPVGSFQAVQHLLADAHCLVEGSQSVALHASWAADALPAAEALHAGRVAKAYCARAARTVCETAIQVHGGIGNTWECVVHVYLRRALLSTQWFGGDGEQLHALARDRLLAPAGSR